MKQAMIYRKSILAGLLTEDGGEYRFCYHADYLSRDDAQPEGLMDNCNSSNSRLMKHSKSLSSI